MVGLAPAERRAIPQNPLLRQPPVSGQRATPEKPRDSVEGGWSGQTLGTNSRQIAMGLNVLCMKSGKNQVATIDGRSLLNGQGPAAYALEKASTRVLKRAFRGSGMRLAISELMTTGTLLLIILVLLLLGALPAWPYSRGWGYYPSGGLGAVLLILLILVLLGVV